MRSTQGRSHGGSQRSRVGSQIGSQGSSPDGTPGRSRIRSLAVAGLVGVVLATLASCSSLGSGDASTAADGGGDAAHPGAPTRDLDTAEGGGGAESQRPPGAQEDSAGQGANRPGVQARAVIRTGEVALVTRTMNQARTEIDALLGRHGGYLASEDTTNDRSGAPERSVLVMRVPEPAFDAVMDELVEIGRTERADRSAEDVTTQVIDVDTRVATQEASLARLQRFLRRAVNVDDMIRLESEIATRQAALESLKAQQKYLSDQTAYSTVTARLRTPAAPPPEAPEDDAGFLAGLADGWSALKSVLVGAATVTGAVLPFAVTLALLGVPAWLLLVRLAARRRRHPVLPPVAPDPT
jgi:hypothetical protein